MSAWFDEQREGRGPQGMNNPAFTVAVRESATLGAVLLGDWRFLSGFA